MKTDDALNEKSNKNSIQKSPSPTEELGLDREYGDLFKHITKLEDGDIIVRANCKFCNHPLRAEAERRFEQANRTNFSMILKFFKDWESQNPAAGLPPMNGENVRSHLLHHYLQQEKRIWIREYGDRLKEMMNYRIDQDQRFDMMTCAIQLKLYEIASDPTLDALKQADTMAKLTKAICDIIITRSKLKADLETEQVVLTQVANAWERTITLAPNPETRRLLLDGFDTFKAVLDGVFVPETIVPEIETDG